MSIPWKIKKETYTVEDTHGNSLALPDYGSLLIDELEFIREVDKRDPKPSDEDAAFEIVSFCLRKRFDLSEDSEPLKGVPVTLITAIFNFILHGKAGSPSKGAKTKKPGKKPTTGTSSGSSIEPTPPTPSFTPQKPMATAPST